MFVLRFFFGGHGPPLLALRGAGGLLRPVRGRPLLAGRPAAGQLAVVAFMAATLFGVGKTYYWPTMLGVTSELLPQGRRPADGPDGRRGHAVHRGRPADHGRRFDKAGAGAALRTVAVLPVILTVVFGVLFAYFRAKGGYRAVKLAGSSAD